MEPTGPQAGTRFDGAGGASNPWEPGTKQVAPFFGVNPLIMRMRPPIGQP